MPLACRQNWPESARIEVEQQASVSLPGSPSQRLETRTRVVRVRHGEAGGYGRRRAVRLDPTRRADALDDPPAHRRRPPFSPPSLPSSSPHPQLSLSPSVMASPSQNGTGTPAAAAPGAATPVWRPKSQAIQPTNTISFSSSSIRARIDATLRACAALSGLLQGHTLTCCALGPALDCSAAVNDVVRQLCISFSIQDPPLMWSLRSAEQEGDVLVTDDNLREVVEKKVPLRCVRPRRPLLRTEGSGRPLKPPQPSRTDAPSLSLACLPASPPPRPFSRRRPSPRSRRPRRRPRPSSSRFFRCPSTCASRRSRPSSSQPADCASSSS